MMVEFALYAEIVDESVNIIVNKRIYEFYSKTPRFDFCKNKLYNNIRK